MRLAIISDTHIPARADDLPRWVREKVESADHTIHAGDFESIDALESVREVAGGNFTAVAGNMDGGELDLPDVATFEARDVVFIVTHGTGDMDGYEDRVASTVADQGGPNTIGVAGHTHEPMDEVRQGVRILNPGSATGADPATEATMMIVEVNGTDVDVTLHRE